MLRNYNSGRNPVDFVKLQRLLIRFRLMGGAGERVWRPLSAGVFGRRSDAVRRAVGILFGPAGFPAMRLRYTW